MALEATTYLQGLVNANPVSSDQVSQGDDHLRLLKATLKSTFPNADRPFYFPSTLAQKSATYTVVNPTDRGAFIPLDTSAGNITINLPSLSLAIEDGFTVKLVKTDFTSNKIIVDPFSAVLVNGQLTMDLKVPFVFANLFWSFAASAWFCEYDPGPEVGDVSGYVTLAAVPPGYVLANGQTIGNAASAGTGRANADCQRLFELLWNGIADAQCPVSSGRGASASADFNANKRITLPDLRGCALVGHDTMGNVAASRIVTFLTSTMGLVGGSEGANITQANLASFTLPDTIAVSTALVNGTTVIRGSSGNFFSASGGGQPNVPSSVTSATLTATSTVSGSVTSGGSNTKHSSVQPSTVLAWKIKL